jgi:hypothetical protein
MVGRHYLKVDRSIPFTQAYKRNGLLVLLSCFRRMPFDYVESTFICNNRQLVPSWDALRVAHKRQLTRPILYFQPLDQPRDPLDEKLLQDDVEFTAEYAELKRQMRQFPLNDVQEPTAHVYDAALVESDDEDTVTENRCSVCASEAEIILPNLNKLKCTNGHGRTVLLDDMRLVLCKVCKEQIKNAMHFDDTLYGRRRLDSKRTPITRNLGG